MKEGILLLIVAVLVFIGPWFTILALNTLFGTSINLTIGTWLAALWIMLVIGVNKGK